MIKIITWMYKERIKWWQTSKEIDGKGGATSKETSLISYKLLFAIIVRKTNAERITKRNWEKQRKGFYHLTLCVYLSLVSVLSPK